MRIFAVVALVAAVAATLGVLSSRDASADSTFTPTSSVRMCNALPATFTDATLTGSATCTEDKTASVPADMSIMLDVPSGHLDASTQITFVPLTVSAGSSMPSSTKIGGIREYVNYGIANGPCNVLTTIDFVLYNVALPDNTGSPYSSTNLAYPLPATEFQRFNKWKIGSPPGGADPSGINPGVTGSHAGPGSVPFDGYPKYLLDEFGGLVPNAAYGALASLGGEWTPIYLLQFNAGQLATLPGAYSRMGSAMGAPMVRVYGDPTEPVLSGINDICSNHGSTIMLLGQDQTATFTRSTNPAAGTQFFLHYLRSERDTDQDGFENAIDTCPLSGGVGVENPRATPGPGDSDADDDGIKDSCDTNSPTATGPDVDGDGFNNNGDNCPQASNSTQAEAETAQPDLGPDTDLIGDACDSGSITVTQNGVSVTITLSTAIANGRYHTRTNFMPKCFGGTDNDNDGYCVGSAVAPDTSATDSTTCAGTIPNSCFFRHGSFIVGSCTSASNFPGACTMDSDGDTFVPVNGSMRVWSDAVETYLGTDPTKPCDFTDAGDDEGPIDTYPLDVNDNRVSNGADWLRVAGAINSTGGSGRAVNMGGNGDGTATTVATVNVPFMGAVPQTRFDLNWDGNLILGSDLGKFNGGDFLHKCGTTYARPATVNNSGTFQQ